MIAAVRITVIGGTGLVGTQLVARLRSDQHDVVAASPATGVNTVTGEGLAHALRDANTVVDVSNAPTFEPEAVMAFFETSARNLAAASRAAGVRHLLLLSIVGTDRLTESPYFRGKLAQENAIRSGGTPFTILRSTQFFEFAPALADSATDGGTVRLPSVPVQPIASRDVAAALAELAVGAPVQGTVEIAGPERMPLTEYAQRRLSAQRDPRVVVGDASARYFGAALSAASLIPERDHRTGTARYDDWLRVARTAGSLHARRTPLS